MKRLTKTFAENGEAFVCFPDCEKGCTYGWCEGEEGCRCKKVESAIIRLSKIENILGDDYDLDRLEQVKAERDELIRRNQLAYEIAWGCDIPSPTVPEYVELHKGMTKIMNALRGRKEETP